MKFKTIITELAIMIALFLATWLIVFWLTPAQDIFNLSFQIKRHDVFIVLGWQTVIIAPFLMLNTLVYFIKEGIHRYKRKFQDVILIAGNFILIVQLCKIAAFIDFLSESGGTFYPVLSAPSKTHKSLQNIADIMYVWQAIFIVLIIFMLILVITTFFTGKNWQSKTHEPTV